MKFIIFFICIPFVYSEFHTFMTAYSGKNGKTSEGIPEFSAVTTLDDHQMDYYDRNTKKPVPKQNWMKEFASTEPWKDYTEIREKLQQINKNNIHELMERFNQSHGVHTYQRMYGCDWDDETGDSQGFDQYAYDGEDFISLDLKQLRYIASVQQAELTVQKWNKDRTQLESLKHYYEDECVYWLKKFLHLSKATLEKADPPEVSLLQKNPDSPVECHVTGFLFRNTAISWRKNGQAMSDSSKLETGDTLLNEDGTFQRTVTLYVHSDEWKEEQYTCVVEHKTEKILTEDEIKRNSKLKAVPGSDASSITGPVVIVAVIVVLIVLCVLWKHREKIKYCLIYSKNRRCETQSMSSEDEMLNPVPIFEGMSEQHLMVSSQRGTESLSRSSLHSSSPVD